MTELGRFLERERQNSSYRTMEERIGVSRGALESLIKRDDYIPEIKTFQAIADYYNLPLWKIMDMAGIDIGMPDDPQVRTAQLMDLARRRPELQPVLDQLLYLDSEDLRPLLAYLRALDRRS